jgi:hypothetical protein
LYLRYTYTYTYTYTLPYMLTSDTIPIVLEWGGVRGFLLVGWGGSGKGSSEGQLGAFSSS